MTTQSMKNLLLIFACVLAFGIAACRQQEPEGTPVARPAEVTSFPTPTLTPTTTATPRATATFTPTPTPTLTPTPTAEPLSVAGDPRQALLREPLATNRARCGEVDLFDFPIDPPHAESVRWGGRDFGVFRGRYDKYHAGEDWGGPAGERTLGTPVYAVGHGVVTFAEPLGWGRDQGVVIVQHVLTDGSTLLSFYGHLEPDSIVLTVGNCVARGDEVGKIGQPRTPPHLHFEMRTQSPYETLGGYWTIDPTTAGWVWPSQTIWNQRITAAEGVVWSRLYGDANHRPLGRVNNLLFAYQQGSQIFTVEVETGRQRAVTPPDVQVLAGAWQPASREIITVDAAGDLRAYAAPADGQVLFSSAAPTIETGLIGVNQLIPLPEGGVALVRRSEVTAVNGDGEPLWPEPLPGRTLSWDWVGDQLFITLTASDPRTLLIEGSNSPRPIAPVYGKTAVGLGWLWIYQQDGVYRLPLNNLSASPELIYPLSLGSVEWGDILPLPDGGVLLAHTDGFDSRLIAISTDGSIRWERSFAPAGFGSARLALVEQQPYLILETAAGSSSSEVAIYEIDIGRFHLERLMVGGTRLRNPADTWVTSLGGDGLLINVGGGSLFRYNPE